MTRNHIIKNISALLIVMMILSVLAVSVSAEDQTEEQTIEVKLQVGSETITINGQELTIEKPYIVNNTTMVPLRVITTAFDAKLSFDQKTQTVGLTYDGHTVQLQIKSTTASFDGKNMKLDAAPALKNNTTMVPLRFIVENFGAKISSYNNQTKEIVITGTAPQNSGASTPQVNIDSDRGKTKIGNSYYGWSMNYPSGLAEGYQSDKQDFVVFSNAAGEYEISIEVEDRFGSAPSPKSMLQRAHDNLDYDETVLNSKYVENGDNDYAYVVGKTAYKSYYEYRVYYSNERLYIVTLSVDKEETYKNKAKYQAMQDLAGSFRTQFDPADSSIKDISTIKDGYRQFSGEDFGLTLDVPLSWETIGTNQSSSFYDSEDNQVGELRITSVEARDTVDAWVARETAVFKSDFLENYRTVEEKQNVNVAGTTARNILYSYSYGDGWHLVDVYYFVIGNYKYELKFIMTEEEKTDAEFQTMLKHIVNSLKIEAGKMNPALGYIHDELDFVDKDKLVTIKNTKYNLSMQVPEYWQSETDGEDSIDYSFNGGEFSLNSEEGYTLEQYESDLESMRKGMEENFPGFRQLQKTNMVLFGQSGKKYVFEFDQDGAIEITTIYLFSSGENVFFVAHSIRKAASTEDNLRRLDEAFKSISFSNN